VGKLIYGIRCLWYFCAGHVYALFHYDKKYLRGRWFTGKMKGVFSVGWKWVYFDAKGLRINFRNSTARYPVSCQNIVSNPQNIEFDPEDLNNFQGFGKYFQAVGKITIGKGTYIGPNVGLITTNHDVNNPDVHLEAKPVVLGRKCWIGMNSVIMPGVVLGDNTVVGAGSIVTKSFEQGNVVIAGNPAKVIKELDNKGNEE